MKGIDRGSCPHGSSVRSYLQVAKATSSTCYVQEMNKEELRAWRIERLEAAVREVAGNNVTAFGKKIGLKDGAYVRQLIAGTRPVSENVIDRVESLPGMRGWFSRPGLSASERAGPQLLRAQEEEPKQEQHGAVDRSALRNAVILVEFVVLSNRLSPSPTRKAEAIANIYDEMIRNPRYDENVLVEEVRRMTA